MAERSLPKLVAMGTTACVLTITIIFNILAMGNPKTALFTNTTGSVYDYYTLEIVPAGWMLVTLWAIIYIWQVLWIGYALSTICRKSASAPLYLHPAQMSIWFYAFFIANNISNIIWQIVWDRFLLVPSLVFLSLVPLTLNGCLVTASLPLSKNQESLIKEGLTREVWMIHIFVENGILVYIAWTEIATLINAAMVMHYLMGVAEELACTIVLVIFTVIFISWFILDIFVFEQMYRYMFVYYPGVVIALSGIINRNWDPTKRNQIFTAVLLAVACLATVVKLVLMVYRHKTRPMVAHKDEHSLIGVTAAASTGNNQYTE